MTDPEERRLRQEVSRLSDRTGRLERALLALLDIRLHDRDRIWLTAVDRVDRQQTLDQIRHELIQAAKFPARME